MHLSKMFLKRTLFTYWRIICVTALGAFLRFYNIGAQPLWLDEGFSFQFAQLPLSQLWGAEALNEANPPLYYTLLKFWIFFFGESETALRSLSAVIGILTIPLLYMLGKTLDKQQLGILAALLLAISPINIQYSQEARAYTLLTMAVTLTILGLAGLLKDPEGAKMPIGQGFIRKVFPEALGNSRSHVKLTTDLSWLACIGGLSIAFYAHSTAVFLLGISSASIFIYWMKTLQFNRIFFWNWIIANTLVLVVWAWWLTFIFRQANYNSWIPFVKVKGAILVLMEVLIEPGREPQYIFQLCRYLLFLGLALLGLWRWRNNLEKLTLVNTFLFGFPLLVFIISLYRPLFIWRIFLWTTIPFYLLVASGIVAFRSRLMIIFIATIFFIFQLRGTVNYYQVQKEPWNEIANYIASRMKQGDKILFYENFLSIPFNYYFRDHSSNTIQYVLVDSYSTTKYSYLNNLVEVLIADIPNMTPALGRTWFVRGHLSNKDSDFATSILSQNMHQIYHHSYIDSLDIYLFENTKELSGKSKLNQDANSRTVKTESPK
jgi:uncharacterized membrane protein